MNIFDRISLVIVTWKGDDVLKVCLDSLIKTYSTLPETIIVDNANQPTTKELVLRYPTIRYIACTHNKGFAGGNNAAIPFCTKEYILLLNNDTEIRTDAFSPLVKFMDDHPSCGSVQGQTVLGCNQNQVEGCGMMLTRIGFLRHPHDGSSLKEVQGLPPFPVFGACGMFLLIRMSAIKAIGGHPFFDEFNSYYEDADLGRRLWLCGYESWYCPTPPVIHHRNFTSKKIGSSKFQQQQKANIWMSMLIAYGWYGRLRFALPLAFLQIAKSILYLIILDAEPWTSNLKVIKFLLNNKTRISEEHGRLKKIRTISDREFIRKMFSLKVPQVKSSSRK